MNYFYTIKNGKPEHNLPERCIIEQKDFKYKFWDRSGYWTTRYITVTDEFFNEQIKPKLFWPSEKLTGYPEYIGAFIIRTEQFGDVLCYCEVKQYTDTDYKPMVIFPIEYFITNCQTYQVVKSKMPKRNVKCFLTKEDWKADQEQKKAKIDKKNTQELNNWKDLRETVQAFSMATPKFKVLDVVKKTDSCSAQAGDIIHGEIPVIEVDEHGPHGKLHGIGTRTNYVEVYVNGKLDKCMSPLIFQKLFLENYRVEIVKQ